MMNVDRVSLPGLRQYARIHSFGLLRHNLRGRLHSPERNLVEEGAQVPQLTPQRHAAAPGVVVGRRERAVLMPHREGIVQVVVQRSSGHQKIPALNPIGRIRAAIEAGLIVADARRSASRFIATDAGGRE